VLPVRDGLDFKTLFIQILRFEISVLFPLLRYGFGVAQPLGTVLAL
jgi:hypothetical protein